jgi:phage recombination protein Bet
METATDNMEPIPVPSNGGEKPFLTEEDKKLLREQYAKDYKSMDIEMFLRRCERTRIDPMTGQIFMRPEGKEGANRDRDGKYKEALTITGWQGFLHVADRSGVYDGSSPIIWCGKNGEWIDIWLQEEHPIAAKAEVWRKDRTRPEIAIVKWKAVYKPTWAWNSMGDHMLGKCAHCAAIRKAFPSQLTGVYEADEIVDKSLLPTTFEQDVKAQEARIAEDAAATDRLKAQGVPVVDQAPGPPRDAVREVEPVMPADKAKLGKPDDYQPGDEPDDIDMTPSERPEGWWVGLSCDPMGNNYYTGKTVGELSENLLRQAVEKWVPKVRKKTDPRDDVLELAEALEIAMAQSQKNAAEFEARQAAKAAEGAQ